MLESLFYTIGSLKDMKNIFKVSLLTVSMLFVAPTVATDAPAETTTEAVAPAATSGFSVTGILNSVINAPKELHTKHPVLTGVAWTAVVAYIAYKMGASENEEEATKKLDLI